MMDKDRFPPQLLLVSIILSLLIIAGGMLLYQSQKKRIIIEKQNELAAIATLKVNDIEKWRLEHIRDGEILRSIIPRNQLIYSFLELKESHDFDKELFERIRIFISDYDYHSIMLVDPEGEVRLSYPPTEKQTILTPTQLKELEDPEIRFSDLHYSSDLPGRIHIDLQIPLYTTRENKTYRFGTLIMRIDPEKVLYPLIQSWPTPSKTSETLLVRSDGDSVVFLNELRHRGNTALSFKLPISKSLPAAAVITGSQGLFEGIDYRGIPVISYLMKIPNSPWSMVAKVDKREIYSPLNELIIFVSVAGLSLILTIGLLIAYTWRNQRIKYLNNLNSTKDKFFSIISHDLKTPFTAIYGFADLLSDSIKTEEPTNNTLLKKYSEIIKSSSQDAVDLLINLIEWAKLQTDRIVLSPKKFDLIQLLNMLIDSMKILATQKSINFITTVPAQLEVYADENMISLVIRNIISNAMKFTNPGGKIHIVVNIENRDVIVSIRDNGIGIKKERIDKLFHTELNVTTPGTQKEMGSGLGLILVKEFISLHGGKVFVQSEEGRWTTFSFTIPNSINTQASS